ncbi:hypothetical protein BDQ12DRAFT_688392 [Crucibulum laeve]|uniref:Uncharacterized protein n=1 Tax=Crucibulum laeve TaxID=68775 RepID=A0A5C3LR36_9AGAR|nr:hypothetical protein BDQ12DRAFT_688392 [Crucibulum laeve]
MPQNITIPISRPGVDSYTSIIKGRLSLEDKKLLKEAHRLWSTRVPDFLRRVFKLWKDGKISIFDLVIEIKKPEFQANIVALAVLRKQVMCQADHIFESEPLVQALGCILAVGSKWRYEEVHRPKVNHTVRAMDKDPDYVPHESEPSSVSSRARYWRPVEPSPEIAYEKSSKPVLEPDAVLSNAFGEHVMIRLDDPNSDSLLEAVYQRLKLLNPQFWMDEGVNDGDKVDLTEIFDGRDAMDVVEDDISEASDAVRDVNEDLEDDELAEYDIDMDS